MSKKVFFALLGVLVLVLAGVYLTRPSSETGIGSDLLFPELAKELNDIDGVRVLGSNRETKVNVAKRDDRWVVVDKMGYPADVAKLRSLLQNLAQAKLVEQKTSKPELYSRLGVEGMESENPTGLLLELGKGDETRSLIIGETGVAGSSGSYVRKPQAAESWLVNQDLSIEANSVEWVSRQVLDIPSDRVQRVEVSTADKSLKVFKANSAQSNFEIENVPTGRELRYDGVADSMAGVLAGLELDDVKGQMEDPGAPNFEATFSTFDGLRLLVSGFESDGKKWISLMASVDEDQAMRFFTPTVSASESDSESEEAEDSQSPEGEPQKPDLQPVQAEVTRINNAAQSWLYAIPDYKYDQIQKDMEDMLKPLEE